MKSLRAVGRIDPTILPELEKVPLPGYFSANINKNLDALLKKTLQESFYVTQIPDEADKIQYVTDSVGIAEYTTVETGVYVTQPEKLRDAIRAFFSELASKYSNALIGGSDRLCVQHMPYVRLSTRVTDSPLNDYPQTVQVYEVVTSLVAVPAHLRLFQEEFGLAQSPQI